MIVLVGFMGAGKTTIGRMLAEVLETEFADADGEIESRAGVSVPEIFSSRGEREFRAMERAVVGDLLERGVGVIAVGGGALQDPTTRAALRARPATTVVYLEVDHDEAMRRVGDDPGRPMLAGPDVRSLHEDRRAAYKSVAAIIVNTTDKAPDEVVGEIQESLSSIRSGGARRRRVTVAVHSRSYDVVVGAGILSAFAGEISVIGGAEKAFAITHPELVSIAEQAASSLRSTGLRTVVLDVPSGESAKSLHVIGELYDRLGKEAAHRNDLIVGVGGGVVTDIAGFVASTFNRGMPVVHVPTTLLGQVDAAIGGKTGINVEHGKNLVGTFYQPCAVVCDVNVLATLPMGELRAGMAEVVKYGLIADPALLPRIERDAELILAANAAVVSEIVARSVEIKASVVAADEREEGGRAILNYGHTFAHAIEQTVGFGRIRHGEAVAIGMMAAAHLGHVLGRFDEPVVEAHRRALSAVGLPVTASLDIDALERAWLRDKKYLHGVRFVLLKAIGEAETGITAPRPAIAKALETLSQ